MKTYQSTMRMKTYLLFLSTIPAMFIVSAGWSAAGDPVFKGDRQQRILEYFDADGNGELSAGERQVAREAMRDRRGKGGAGLPDRRERMERFDTDGDGQLSREERDAARASMRRSGSRCGMNRQAMMERFDTDGDGVLSDAERETALTARRGKTPPVPAE